MKSRNEVENAAFQQYRKIVIIAEIIIPLFVLFFVIFLYYFTGDIIIIGLGGIVGSFGIFLGIYPLKRGFNTGVPQRLSYDGNCLVLYYTSSKKCVKKDAVYRIDYYVHKKDWIIIKIYLGNSQKPITTIVDGKSLKLIQNIENREREN